jgi:hypothetical protein
MVHLVPHKWQWAGSAGSDGTFEGDQEALHATWAHPPLDLGARDRSELPSVPGLVVQHALQLVRRELASDQALA